MAFSFRARDDAHSPRPQRLPLKDYAPPEQQHADRALEALKAAQHVVAFNGFELEREVMPPEASSAQADRKGRDIDTRPPSATEANQPKPLSALEAIAIDIRGLPYEQFMELAKGVGAQPVTLWKWATTHGQD